MLVDVIFRGLVSMLDFSFLKDLLSNAREIRFSFPEDQVYETYDKVVDIINSDVYVDLIINTSCLLVGEKIVPRVFINLGRNNEDIEVLFFFDLNDIGEDTPIRNLEYLKGWMIKMQDNYHFQYFICQFDEAAEDEYYFDSNGIGKLYPKSNN